MLLNTKNPDSPDTEKLAESLFERYGVPVIPMDIMKAGKDDFANVLLKILMEFPIKSIDINLPKWMRALGQGLRIIAEIIGKLLEDTNRYSKMRDYEMLSGLFEGSEIIEDNPDIEVDSATGTIKLSYKARDGGVLQSACRRVQHRHRRRLQAYELHRKGIQSPIRVTRSSARLWTR